MTVDEMLERTQWDFFWLPPDAELVERPELLYVRSQRPTWLLNVVTRTRPRSAADAEAFVDEVSAAHAGPSSFLVTPQSGAAFMTPALEAGGYRPGDAFDAMVTSVAEGAVRRGAEVEVRAVETLQDLRDNLEIWSAKVAHAASDADLARDLAGCTGPGRRTWRFTAYVNGEPVSMGNINVFPGLGFAFLWGGTTLPEYRGRGLYTAVVQARIAQARALGLTHAGLYAKLDTSAPIVEKQGFQRHGRMEQWHRHEPG